MYSRANLACYCFLVLLLISYRVHAQPKCKIEHYSTEDGLSHEAVTCIMKDREGFMWFGSWDGINRFDGHTFVSYKSSPGDMSQLKNDRIDQIVEDKSNHLWLKCYDNQIYRFDKKTEQFLPLANIIDTTGKKKIAFDKIMVSNNGDIWLISAHEGLFYFPQTDPTLRHFIRYNAQGIPEHRLPSNNTRIIYEDANHNIWVATTNGLGLLVKSGDGKYNTVRLEQNISEGLSINSAAEDKGHLYFASDKGQIIGYSKYLKNFIMSKVSSNRVNSLILSKNKQFLYATTSAGEVLAINPHNLKVTSAAVNSSGALYTMYEDRKGFLWITPEKMGITRFNPQSGLFQSFSQPTGAKYMISNRCKIFEDNNGLVWVSMKSGGFGYFDEIKGKVAYFYNEPGSANHQFSNIVTDLYYDNAGILWLNTDDRGIDKIIFQPNNFNQHLMVAAGAFKADNEVRGILCDHNNRLWVGSKAGSLYVYQQGKQLTDIFVNEPPGGLGQVYAMMEDSHGNIWLGTKTNGLFKAVPVDLQKSKYRLTHFLADKKDKQSLSSNQVYALVEDLKGRIWVGTYDGGLNLINGDGASGRFIHTGRAFAGYPKNGFDRIRNMTLDKTGNIWIATTGGLLVLNADDQHSAGYRYVTYSKIPGDGTSLGNNDIQFVFRDSRDTMWLATSGGGLNKVIGNQPFKSLQFKNYTTKDGLSNDYVLSCTEDKHGDLWVATQHGLSKFNLKDRHFRNYDSYDGLPKIGFSEASSTRFQNFNPVFGTVKGYLSFDPDQVTDHKINANLVLTNLQVNNEDVNINAKDKVLTDNINYSPGLTLKYEQNTISVDYVVLDQRLGYREAYAYRLKNFDAVWRNNKNQRRATYTNLPPGDYTFEVKSVSMGLYTNLPYRSLKITILSPPWRTWWAYLIYSILAAVLVSIIRRNALTMLRLRNNIAVEKRLADLKLSFFTNVSHELRTPLTLILNPIEEIGKIFIDEKLSYKGSEYVNVVRRNANRMVRFINQLLDLRKVQSGKMAIKLSQIEVVSFVTNISSYFSDVAREKNIGLKITSENPVIFAWIDAEKIDIVIYNILANAFKFTSPEKVIHIRISKISARNSLSIVISDQGGGVDPRHLSDIFELYYEGENTDSTSLKGTGIGLALSKELVGLHHGKISAQNNSDNGLTVTVELKLGKEHFAADEVTYVDVPLILHELEKTMESAMLTVPDKQNPHGQDVPLVLLVEDNSELRTFLSIQLGEFYRVETAKNGAEGLKKAMDILPDIILSDVMMPIMNGIHMLDQLKNDPSTSHIPVIILSARFSVEHQIEGLKYGADYYITKPFHNDFLLASIDNLLKKRKQIFETLLSGKKVVELSPGEIAITAHDEVFLKKIIGIVEEKMYDPEFNIEVVADALNMSRSPFYKKFKSLTSLAPVEFVRDMRLKRGKQYFDAGNTDIAEVSFLTGFSNSKYFNKCFKEKFGISPTEYLKTMVSRNIIE